jgi:hypothetical protein
VSFSTVVSVVVACLEESSLIAGMIMGLTALTQLSNVPHTCRVRVILCLSTSGVLSGGSVSWILACWGREGLSCWKLWRACWM